MGRNTRQSTYEKSRSGVEASCAAATAFTPHRLQMCSAQREPTSPAVKSRPVARILEIRGQHPLWGRRRSAPCSSASSLSSTRPRLDDRRDPASRRAHPATQETPPHTALQRLWHTPKSPTMSGIDFKGWFLCRDGSRIDPLTLVQCQPLRAVLPSRRCCNFVQVRRVLESVFLQYGLTARHPQRQRRAVCEPCHQGFEPLERVVAEAGHRGGTHSPGEAQRQRPPRAFSSHAQATHGRSAGGESERNSEPLKAFVASTTSSGRTRRWARQVPASLYPSQLPEIEYPSSPQARSTGAGRGSSSANGEPLGLEARGSGLVLLVAAGHVRSAAASSRVLRRFPTAVKHRVFYRATRVNQSASLFTRLWSLQSYAASAARL